jgi:hypothetical protein
MASFLIAALQPTPPEIASTELLCKEDHQPALQSPGCCKENANHQASQLGQKLHRPAGLATTSTG